MHEADSRDGLDERIDSLRRDDGDGARRAGRRGCPVTRRPGVACATACAQCAAGVIPRGHEYEPGRVSASSTSATSANWRRPGGASCTTCTATGHDRCHLPPRRPGPGHSEWPAGGARAAPGAWRTIRLSVLRRDGGCARCGSEHWHAVAHARITRSDAPSAATTGAPRRGCQTATSRSGSQDGRGGRRPGRAAAARLRAMVKNVHG